ncbi:hypothetical protein A2U01_0050199, partial [Trifolium medium]|nr:hypothetical protein [Trifolium medium]
LKEEKVFIVAEDMEEVVHAQDVVVVEAEVLLVRFVIDTIMMPLSVITDTQEPYLAMAIDLHSFNLLSIRFLSTFPMAMVINQDHNNNVLRLCSQEEALLSIINGGILTQVLLTMSLLMQQISQMLLPYLVLTKC